MRINRFEEIMGVVPQADVMESRLGLICRNLAGTYDYGSREHLPGWRVPATADEAEQACYFITWQVTQAKPPFYGGQPNSEPSFRYGWDQAVQFPAPVTLYTTWPGYQECLTIPSGFPSLAYGVGTYTIPSGCYIDNINLHFPGAYVVTANTAEDGAQAGMPKYQATSNDRVIGIVEDYEPGNGELTIRLRR